ncbi:MAG: DUF308 domain-containing protein [Clostridia bacterium]|nr:DUF308 domain-containing protein [Clostridia bacterium]
MKKTERILLSLGVVVLGVLLVVLRDKIVSVLMTTLGIGLIAYGIVDIVNRLFPPAVIKLAFGLVIVLCGWFVVAAVLYLLAAFLLIVGVLLLYEKLKTRVRCSTLLYTLCEYAVPVVFLLIGVLLLFNQGNTVAWVFVSSGIFTVLEGGLLLVGAFSLD